MEPLQPLQLQHHHGHGGLGQGLLALLGLPQQNCPLAGLQRLIVDAVFLAVHVGDGRVEIVAAEGVVAADGQNIHHVFKAVHHRNIQRTAAEVIDQKGRVTLFRS